MIQKLKLTRLLVLSFFLMAMSAQASLTTDLQTLKTDLEQINSELVAFTFNQQNSCTQLGTLNTTIEDYMDSMEMVYQQMTAPLSITAEDMTSLDDLTTLSVNMAGEAVRLSWELRTLDDVADLFEYRTALSAMLRLSDDIGTMADRILEMADRILIMADNINLMADRILATQRLQYNNMAILQNSLLTTQKNMVALSDSLSTITYNLTLGQLKMFTGDLSDEMTAINLTNTNMATELQQLTQQTDFVFGKTIELFDWIIDNSTQMSHFVSGDTLDYLVDLSIMHKALAASIESYSNTMNQLAANTDSVILKDAIQAMLRLTADIGKMSNRIMEMSNKIIVMADNMGVMADKIVETEQLMQTNMILTQNSLRMAQDTSIAMMKTWSL